MGNKIFRNSAWDLCLVAVIPVQIAIFVCYALFYEQLAWWVICILFPLHFLLSLQGTAANHNHYHTPVFFSKKINGLLRIGYSAIGSPKTSLNIGHGIHHSAKESFNEASVMDVMGLSQPLHIQIVGFFRYYLYSLGMQYFMFLVLLRIWDVEKLVKFAMRDQVEMGTKFFRALKKPENMRAAQLDVLAWFSFRILLISISWEFFFFYFVPANFIIDTFRQNENFVQHWGATDPNDNTRDSVSCYGRFYNYVAFNLGYHQEHHYRPATHWLNLPALTAELPSDRRVVPFIHYVNMPCFYPEVESELKNGSSVCEESS